MFKSVLPRLACALAFVAILARAAIPAGYMPDLNNDSFQIVICTIEGSKKITVDGNFNPVQPGHNKKALGLCDFNLVKNLSLDAPAAILFVYALTFLDIAFLVMRSQIVHRALRLPILQSRAPPFFSF